MTTKKITSTNRKKTSSAKTKTTSNSKKKITAEDIRLRAQQIYHERINKGHHGDELSDWLIAEKELTSSK